MRLRHITGSEEIVKNSPWVIKNFESLEEKELRIELGMGKGDFIIKNALENSDIFFVGVEKYASCMIKALDKANNLVPLPSNLKFMCEDVALLKEILPKACANIIYLNFSDPWPKKKHSKRRLTSSNFLDIYEYLLKKDGRLEFKTDNFDLFNYSLESLQENDWIILQKTYDLHNDKDMNKNNIMTEYETKFSANGNKICKLVCFKKY